MHTNSQQPTTNDCLSLQVINSTNNWDIVQLYFLWTFFSTALNINFLCPNILEALYMSQENRSVFLHAHYSFLSAYPFLVHHFPLSLSFLLSPILWSVFHVLVPMLTPGSVSAIPLPSVLTGSLLWSLVLKWVYRLCSSVL